MTRCAKRIFRGGQGKSPVTDRPEVWSASKLVQLVYSSHDVAVVLEKPCGSTRLGGEHDLEMCAKTLKNVLSSGGTKHSLPRMPADEFCPTGLGALSGM